MRRERALKIVLVIVGLLFCAGVYPQTMFFSREPAVPMIMSIYVTLGVFLLLAVRNPSANRSLIAFKAWSSLVHAGAGIPPRGRAWTSAGRHTCASDRGRRTDRAGSGETSSQAIFYTKQSSTVVT